MTRLAIYSPDLRTLAFRLQRESRECSLQFKRRVREAAMPARRAIEVSATQAGMMKASRAVSVRQSYAGKTASIRVVVSARKAPNARPLDKPNHGVYNRHPVWGSSKLTRNKWHWTDQPGRPFFDRGARVGEWEAEKALTELLTDYMNGIE